jgi:hypothetical protein
MVYTAKMGKNCEKRKKSVKCGRNSENSLKSAKIGENRLKR